MHLIEITKTKVLIPRACLTLAVVVYPVLVFCVTDTLPLSVPDEGYSGNGHAH